MLIVIMPEMMDEYFVMRNILSLKYLYKSIYIKSLKEKSRGENTGFNFKNCVGDIDDLFRRTYVLKLVKTLIIQNLFMKYTYY